MPFDRLFAPLAAHCKSVTAAKPIRLAVTIPGAETRPHFETRNPGDRYGLVYAIHNSQESDKKCRDSREC